MRRLGRMWGRSDQRDPNDHLHRPTINTLVDKQRLACDQLFCRCDGRWPRKAGLRRAARFDGVLLTFADQRNSTVPMETFADAVGFVRELTGNRPFDIAVEGATCSPRSHDR